MNLRISGAALAAALILTGCSGDGVERVAAAAEACELTPSSDGSVEAPVGGGDAACMLGAMGLSAADETIIMGNATSENGETVKVDGVEYVAVPDRIFGRGAVLVRP